MGMVFTLDNYRQKKSNDGNMVLQSVNNNFISYLSYLPIRLYLRLFSQNLKNNIFKQRKKIHPSEPADNFVINTQHMHAICSSQGIRYYTILQPMNGIGNRTLTQKDQQLLLPFKKLMVTDTLSKFDFFVQYYNLVRKKMKNNPYFFDFTDCFDNEKDQIFTDPVHSSSKGYRIIAEKIYEIIKKEEEE